MSDRQKVTLDDLNREERLVLCAINGALRMKDKRVNIRISKKTVDVSVAPWSEETTFLWKKIIPAGVWECQNCGQNVMTADIEAYKYCHGCGARMEVSGDD